MMVRQGRIVAVAKSAQLERLAEIHVFRKTKNVTNHRDVHVTDKLDEGTYIFILVNPVTDFSPG